MRTCMTSFRILLAQVCACAILAIIPAWAPAAEVTTASLLEEMIDLGRLASTPEPAYSVYQVSSHDRRANLPNGPDWFANSDGFGSEPIPAVVRTIKKADQSGIGTYVLAEQTGPGAIVRCWTAAQHRAGIGMNGTIRLYLDGAEKPIFDGSANEFLINLYPALAKQHGLDSDGLSAGFTQRDSCYCPVGFAKSCRIEWTGALRAVHFYHIELRRYTDGAEVETFEPRQLDMLREKIKQVGAVLADPSSRPPAEGENVAIAATIPAGESQPLMQIEDRSGRITELRLKLSAEDLDRGLRQTVLRVFFDGYSRPQIESPLGDFFGAAPGVNPLDSIPMKVEPDGTMTCRFVMPFAKRVDIWAENTSPEAVEISGRAVVSDAKWDADRDMHFLAKWRANHNMQVDGRHGFDLPFLRARGSGRFVGCSVHLMNPSSVPGVNWWGEGDEKIFVDDDGNEPSFFGTGSEDYFNYSWSEPDLFYHAYFAQPRCDGPATRGFVVNNRWHILDDIPFEKRFDFFMELLTHNTVDGMSYARICYYYGRPGIYGDRTPLFREDLRVIKSPENWTPLAVQRQRGAIYYQLEDAPGAEGMAEEGPLWARGKRVGWRPKEAGESITMDFDVAKAGKYRVYIVLNRSPKSGKCELQINGKSRKSLDLYEPFHTMLRAYSLGTLDLPQGKNTLTVVSQGKNNESQGTLVGADFLWIQP